MKQSCSRADSFVLKSRRIRIYRVRHHDSGTVLWTSANATLRYLKKQQIQHLQNKPKGQGHTNTGNHKIPQTKHKGW
jgi:hypothetical protein